MQCAYRVVRNNRKLNLGTEVLKSIERQISPLRNIKGNLVERILESSFRIVLE